MLVVVDTWAVALANTDTAFACYFCSGLQFGFRIGFSGCICLKPATCNMPSAYEYPTVVFEDLTKELACGHLLGPFNSPVDFPLCNQACRSHPQGPNQEMFIINPPPRDIPVVL